MWYFGQKLVVFARKVVVFVAKWLYSLKSGCIWISCFYSRNMVAFRQCGFIRVKSCCIRARVIVIRKSGRDHAKVLVFGQGG